MSDGRAASGSGAVRKGFEEELPMRPTGSRTTEKERGNAALGGVVGLLLLLAWAVPSGATHYPPGWKCYECHAVSASKLVPGTHLIKQSQKTFDLGITSTDPVMRCLFCHDAFRSAANPDGLARDRMKGVDEHFGAGALSKHPVDVTASTFLQENTAFDCLDCHSVTGVQADGAGNANVHGVDASAALLPVESTLVGGPADLSDAELSLNTCQNANCHDADGGSLNGYTAPARHGASNATITLNDAAVAEDPVYCTRCHGAHGSLDGEALLVLQNTSGSNGQPATGATVSLDACDVCHTKDENGGLADNFYAYGHGRMLDCTGCHELRHDADGDGAFDPAPRLKGNLALDTTAGTSTFGTNFYGNCRACHAGHAAHTPTPASGGDAGTGRSAGCSDCHDPHGTTAADTTFQNDTMIRRTIQGEEVRLPGDLAQIGPPPSEGGSGDTYDGDWFNPGGGTTIVTTGTCDNVACHTTLTTDLETDHKGGALSATTCATGSGCHVTHLGAGKQGTTMGAASCDGCHGFPPDTNAHQKHVDTAGFACEACHGLLGGSGGTSHNESGIGNSTEYDNTWATSPGTIRNNVDLDLPYDGTNPNGAYTLAKGSRPNDTTTYGTCNTLYCHGADAPFPTATMQGADTTPEWDNPATGACGTCHLDTNDTWNGAGSNRHNTHVGTVGGYDYGCDLCHYATTTDGSTITSPANHVNKLADVAFNGNDPRLNTSVAPVSTYTGDTVVGSGYGTCDNTFCHSKARDLVPPFEDAPNSGAMTWDNASGSCSNCHDGPLGGGPGYADGTLVDGNPKANKHQKHRLNGTGSTCAHCHGWFNMAFTTYHADGDYDPTGGTVHASGLDGFTFTQGAVGGGVNGTCSSVGCHGGNTVGWADSGPITCGVCHGQVNGSAAGVTDVNDFVFWDGVQSKVNDVPTTGEFATSGHGAKGLTCAACHDSNVDHDGTTDLSGANPFRLIDQDAGTAGVQFSCSYTGAGCHAAGTIGPATGLDISTFVTHSSAEMASAGYAPKYTWSFAPGCVNCHDPHGDDANLSMVQRELYDKAAFGLPAGPPPAEPTEQTALAFTDDTTGQSTTGTSYADSDTPYSSICQECHEGTPGTDTPYVFVDDTSASASPHPGGAGNPGDCSSCHKHNSAFKPSGCSGCHGGGTAGASEDNYWPDSSNTREENTKGRHDKHMDRLASQVYGETVAELLTDNTAQNPTLSSDQKQRELCSYCHTTPGADADHSVNLPAEVNSMFTIWDKTADDGVYDNAADTCSNVDCHNNKASWPGSDGWYDSVANGCLLCHTRGGATNDPTSGIHVTPVNIKSHSFDCASCHDSTSPSSAHWDGVFQDSTQATFSFGSFITYSQATGCAAICHSDAMTWFRRWIGVVDQKPGPGDNPGDPVCNNCHGDFTNGWRWDEAQATTTDHTDPYAGNTGDQMGQHAGCQICHGWGHANYDQTWGTGQHGNGNITMNGPDASHGTAAGAEYNDTIGGCEAACHSNAFVMDTNSNWTADYGDFGSGSCDACHGPGGSGPTVVWPAANAAGKATSYGSHLGAASSENNDTYLGGVTDWSTQCNKCHTFHSGPVQVPLPPASWDNPGTGATENWDMQARLGIDYASNGAIHLGGTATSGTTEAELCWNCHGTDDAINEWGTNADTNGTTWPVVQIPDVNGATAGSYNYGWLYSDSGWTTLTSFWVNTSDPAQGMYRKDGYQHDANTTPSYALSRRISSVHSVDFTVGSNPGSSVANNVDASGNVIRSASQVLEPRSRIRCSYCHDVHDLNKAPGDAQSGRPHLRGSWMGNPYPPDMPPLSGYTYPTTGGPAAAPLSVGNRFSFNNTNRGESGQFSAPVPRLWADPVSRNKGGYFIDANSGRPTGDTAYDTLAETAGLCTLCHGTDVDNMDYYTGSNLWLGTNGHSNSTLEGTGANGVDLFDARRGQTTWLFMAHQDGVNVLDYGADSGAETTGPFRADFNGLKPAKRGGEYAPPRNTGWYGGTPGSITPGAQYDAWYDTILNSGVGTDGVNATAHKFSCSKCHSPHATGLPALLITNCLDKNVSNWSTVNSDPSIQQANNCHRNEGTTSGWHRLNVGQ